MKIINKMMRGQMMLQNFFKKLFDTKQTKNVDQAVKSVLPDASASDAGSSLAGSDENKPISADCLDVSDLDLPPEQLLEHAFFAWLFATEENQFTKELDGVKEKEKALLSFIDETLLDVDKLPRQPASLPMLIKLLNDENSSNAQISKALLKDPALTAQILVTSNSPFFSRNAEPVTSIDQAVLSLGRIGIRNIVSASIMMPMMKNRNGQDSDLTRRLWDWGMVSALACDQYAISESKDPGLYYLLGLLLPLSYLLIHNALESYAQDKGEKLEPLIIKNILMSQSWKLCQELCEQWDLPLGDDSKRKQTKEVSITELKLALEAGVFLSMHAMLMTQDGSPIGLDELNILTQKPRSVDTQILKLIEAS